MKRRAATVAGAEATFRSALRDLRALCPTPCPVRVRRCKLPPERYGDCDLSGRQFVIRVSNEIGEDAQVLVLVHEYAHAMTWNVLSDDHGPFFGVAYAQAYNAVFED